MDENELDASFTAIALSSIRRSYGRMLVKYSTAQKNDDKAAMAVALTQTANLLNLVNECAADMLACTYEQIDLKALETQIGLSYNE